MMLTRPYIVNLGRSASTTGTTGPLLSSLLTIASTPALAAVTESQCCFTRLPSTQQRHTGFSHINLSFIPCQVAKYTNGESPLVVHCTIIVMFLSEHKAFTRVVLTDLLITSCFATQAASFKCGLEPLTTLVNVRTNYFALFLVHVIP